MVRARRIGVGLYWRGRLVGRLQVTCAEWRAPAYPAHTIKHTAPIEIESSSLKLQTDLQSCIIPSALDLSDPAKSY